MAWTNEDVGAPEWWVLVLRRALNRVDLDGRWRSGRRTPHTRGEVMELRTVEALQRELRGYEIKAPNHVV